MNKTTVDHSFNINSQTNVKYFFGLQTTKSLAKLMHARMLGDK